jgi:hypothetical protein
MTDTSELDEKVCKFLENRYKRPDNLATESGTRIEIVDKIDDKQTETELESGTRIETPTETELESGTRIESPKKSPKKTNKKQKKQEKPKKKQEKKQSAKAILLKELIAKIKKYKHPVDIKTLSNMSMQKITSYALFIDEFYNKQRAQTATGSGTRIKTQIETGSGRREEEQSPIIIKKKPKKTQHIDRPPMQLILNRNGNEYYYTLYE